mgnify:CR=1 FL=1
MSDLVNTTIAVARVGIFLTNYTGYKFTKRVEDEASIRQWLMVKLDSAHQNGIKALESSHSKSNSELSKVIKDMLGTIESFKNDSNLAVTGTKGKFFTSKSTATVASISQLVEYDALILEKADKITSSLKSLFKAIMNEEKMFLSLEDESESDVTVQWEASVMQAAVAISAEILDIHNKFRERIKYIRGFGHK